MCDIICDVINYCALSFDVEKNKYTTKSQLKTKNKKDRNQRNFSHKFQSNR